MDDFKTVTCDDEETWCMSLHSGIGLNLVHVTIFRNRVKNVATFRNRVKHVANFRNRVKNVVFFLDRLNGI